MHNRIDWCVRGYSHGFYNRGQDSAGLLMYEQSSRNVVAYNSVTHGGDGLFLWAGQSTMDTGTGGVERQPVLRQRFQPRADQRHRGDVQPQQVRRPIASRRTGTACGAATASNRSFLRNVFARNTEAIAIEHGQDNVIALNTFTDDETGIRLWWNPTQDPNWGYPKHRDTDSRDYLLAGNTFAGVKAPSDITGTRNVRREDAVPDTVPDVTPPPRFPDGIDAMIPSGSRRGRQYIIVDEWGPYDWQSPKLWPAGRSDETPLRLRVLGPEGTWRLDEVRGAKPSATSGSIPGELILTPAPGDAVDMSLRLRDNRGRAFGYERFFLPMLWSVRFHDFSHDPKLPEDPEAFGGLLAAEPASLTRVQRLQFLSSRAIADGVPINHVAVAASADVEVPAGAYDLQVISDDGVRVWVDDRLVIDRWAAHESAVDQAPITRGKHKVRVEYYELTGFAELRVDVVKRR